MGAELETLVSGNVHAFYRKLGTQSSAHYFEAPDYQVVRAAGAWPHCVFAPQPSLLDTSKFQQLLQAARSEQVPAHLILSEAEHQLFAPLLQAASLSLKSTLLGMYTLPSLPQPPSPDLTIHTVTNDTDLDHWCHITETVLFNKPHQDRSTYRLLLQDPQVCFLLALKHKQPVATALSFTTSKTTGIYMVATLPDYRRQGLGTALVCNLISAHQPTILQATLQGESLYRQIQFIPAAKYYIYSLIP